VKQNVLVRAFWAYARQQTRLNKHQAVSPKRERGEGKEKKNETNTVERAEKDTLACLGSRPKLLCYAPLLDGGGREG
jgi:hypothetical protein